MKHAVWVYDQYHSSEESGNKCERDGKKLERNERNKKFTTGVEQERGGVRLADWQVNQAKIMLWNALTDSLSLN